MSITSYTLKIKRYVTVLNQCQHWWWWDGVNMPRRLSTTIRHIEINHPRKRKSSLFQPSVHVVGQRKSHPIEKRHLKSTLFLFTQMVAKDVVMQEEADSGKVEADEAQPIKTTPITNWQKSGNSRCTFGRRGASMPDEGDKTTLLNANIAAKSTTMKRTAEIRNMSRLTHDNNSAITPPTPTMMTMAKFLWWDIEQIPCWPLLRLASPIWKTNGSSTRVPWTIWRLTKNVLRSTRVGSTWLCRDGGVCWHKRLTLPNIVTLVWT